MRCTKCGKDVSRSYSYFDDKNVWHSTECDSCYPLGKVNTWSAMDKLRSRSLAPDGKTVVTGKAGVRMNDAKRRAAHA